jgi:hypothetical protein
MRLAEQHDASLGKRCYRIVSLFIAAGINPCAHGRTMVGMRCADTERSDCAR